jgi:hypothetical protein
MTLFAWLIIWTVGLLIIDLQIVAAVPPTTDANIKDKPKLVAIVKDLKSRDVKVILAAITRFRALGTEAKPIAAALVEHGMMSLNPKVRTAANEAMEELEPKSTADIMTVLYDRVYSKQFSAAQRLHDARTVAALPALKRLYQQHVASVDVRFRYFPEGTIELLLGMVKLGSEDAGVQKAVMNLVMSSDQTLERLGQLPTKYAKNGARAMVVSVMQEMSIANADQASSLAVGVATTRQATDAVLMATTLSKLELTNLQKCDALSKALGGGAVGQVAAANELAKLGADGTLALPLLTRLKSSPEESVRTACTRAITAITK